MAITYKLRNWTSEDGNWQDILLKEDGVVKAAIPKDPANSDYAEYLEWVAAGNTPEAAD